LGELELGSNNNKEHTPLEEDEVGVEDPEDVLGVENKESDELVDNEPVDLVAGYCSTWDMLMGGLFELLVQVSVG